jgi:hypothetical protein
MTTTEDRNESGLGACERDYEEICRALSNVGGWDLMQKFENMVGDIANHCYDQTLAEALGGSIINGVFEFESNMAPREFRLRIPSAPATTEEAS